ncbi:MAG: putative PEP-binding protein, partial [Planctomycetia bacterium]
TGEVMEGKVATKPSEVVQVLISKTMKPADSKVYQQFAELMGWADEVRKLKVRANADKPDQAEAAVAFGAEGIGLCRTEHMFFDHILPMREMILSTTVDQRRAALAKLLKFQRDDFAGLFRAMKGKPVTIRTLDPPLHEFLP